MSRFSKEKQMEPLLTVIVFSLMPSDKDAMWGRLEPSPHYSLTHPSRHCQRAVDNRELCWLLSYPGCLGSAVFTSKNS